MKDIIITDNAGEKILLREKDDVIALVHEKHQDGCNSTAMVMNHREALNLYMALQEIILGRAK